MPYKPLKIETCLSTQGVEVFFRDKTLKAILNLPEQKDIKFVTKSVCLNNLFVPEYAKLIAQAKNFYQKYALLTNPIGDIYWEWQEVLLSNQDALHALICEYTDVCAAEFTFDYWEDCKHLGEMQLDEITEFLIELAND